MTNQTTNPTANLTTNPTNRNAPRPPDPSFSARPGPRAGDPPPSANSFTFFATRAASAMRHAGVAALLALPLLGGLASGTAAQGTTQPVASFESTSSGAAEDGGVHNVRVNFSPAPAAALTLEYTLGDTKWAATRNVDFTVADTVAVAKDATYVDIPVTMIDDDQYEPLETVKLILTDTDHYDLDLVSWFTLFIDDDEVDRVTRIRGWTRETSCNSECATRWKRVLKALGPVKVDLINLTPMTSSEAEEIARQDTAQSSRWTEVIAALKKREALAPTSAFVPNAELVANIRQWLNETQHGQLHSYRWVRVLIALGEEKGDDEPMTVTEAQSYVDKGWQRWVAVVAELNRKAACDAGDTSQCSGVPAGQQAEEPVPQTPEVNITAVSGGTEGGDATFTLTATPAPASNLAVSVTVTATGDYGVATGDRTVTIPTTGSATLAVATVDDSADEPNGSVTLTLNAGDGYAVGALSSLAADILDDDDPVERQMSTYAPSAQLVANVRGYAQETDNGQAHVDRWLRVLAAFGDDNGHAPMTAAEARGHAAEFWSARWDPVVEALAALESAQASEPAPETQPAPEPEPEPVACVAPELRADVEGYSKETWEGSAHVERWLRVLQTFSGTASEGSKMSSAEAQRMAATYWAKRWDPVVAALQCLEARS